MLPLVTFPYVWLPLLTFPYIFLPFRMFSYLSDPKRTYFFLAPPRKKMVFTPIWTIFSPGIQLEGSFSSWKSILYKKNEKYF